MILDENVLKPEIAEGGTPHVTRLNLGDRLPLFVSQKKTYIGRFSFISSEDGSREETRLAAAARYDGLFKIASFKVRGAKHPILRAPAEMTQ